MIFIQQGGNNRHEHVCASLELFADQILGDFKSREADRLQSKAQALAPYVESARARIPSLPAPDRLPEVDAYPNSAKKKGREVPEHPMGASVFSLLGVERPDAD